MALTFIKIATVDVGAGGASTISFTTIPQTYTDLCVKLSLRSNRAADEDGLGLRINSNTTGYTYRILTGNGATAGSINTAYEQTWSARIQGANAGANIFSSTDVYIPNYSVTGIKTYYADSATEKNSTNGYITLGGILQSNTSAITDIYFSALNGTLQQYSTATLYGILKS